VEQQLVSGQQVFSGEQLHVLTEILHIVQRVHLRRRRRRREEVNTAG